MRNYLVVTDDEDKLRIWCQLHDPLATVQRRGLKTETSYVITYGENRMQGIVFAGDILTYNGGRFQIHTHNRGEEKKESTAEGCVDRIMSIADDLVEVSNRINRLREHFPNCDRIALYALNAYKEVLLKRLESSSSTLKILRDMEERRPWPEDVPIDDSEFFNDPRNIQ